MVCLAKSNYAPLGQAFEVRLDVPDGEAHPAITCVGRSLVEASALLNDQGSEVSRSDRDDAADFLRRVLADGDRLSADVHAEAAAEGISVRTLERARKDVGVVHRREGFGTGGKTWLACPDAHTPPPAPCVAELAEDGGEGADVLRQLPLSANENGALGGVSESPLVDRDLTTSSSHAPPAFGDPPRAREASHAPPPLPEMLSASPPADGARLDEDAALEALRGPAFVSAADVPERDAASLDDGCPF